ncbi:MAG: serine/threonine-protein kinase [Pirellulales bacterium]
MADLVGKELKDYYILRRLGRGAMAQVYLAQQASLNRPVALKVLNEELARDPAYVRRFHHEARAAAALVHASIVQIYEVGQDNGIHYIAQEYVPGRNLGEIIHAQGAIQPRLALDILRQVTAALAKAASEGIVHRDIKPENIMLARSGEVKVADFGLARVQGDGSVNLTQVGVTMGTPLYMSPEQIEGGQLDSRSDIYSLGVTAYHMLAGSPPFAGDSPLSVAVQHLNQSPEPLSRRRPDIPARFAAVVDRMLAKKPNDRYADPSVLLRELHQLAGDGAAAGWAAKPDDWSLSEMIMVADDRAEATSRLESLMKTSSMAQQRRSSWKWRAMVIAGCVLLGAAAAGVLGRPSLLADREQRVIPYDDAWQQFYHAKTVDKPAAWEAVITRFPLPNADPYCHNLARVGLARYYLRERSYAKAIDPLEKLANLTPADRSFKVFGNAGLVVAYTNLGKNAEALRADALLDAAMRQELQADDPRLFELLDDARKQLAKVPQDD